MGVMVRVSVTESRYSKLVYVGVIVRVMDTDGR